MDDFKENALEQGLRQGFINSHEPANDGFKPYAITNNKTSGNDLLSVLKEQLAACDSFDFCVAFVADGGLQTLVDVLAELKRKHVKGRFLTSTYLNFNSPDVFRKLLEYDNIEVRVYQGSLHAKGYVFDRDGVSTVIVGSSNLTATAITCNKEWNVLFRSFGEGGVLRSIKAEFGRLWSSELTARLTPEWVERYEAAIPHGGPRSPNPTASREPPA